MTNHEPDGSATNVGELIARIRSLTPRETEVLDLVLKGLSNDQVALAILRSPKTVDKHCQRIYRKLGIHKRVSLFRLCQQAGYEGARSPRRAAPAPMTPPPPVSGHDEFSLIEQLVLKGRAWDILQTIHSRISDSQGAGYFGQISRAIAETFGVKMAGVCEINPADGYGDIIACWADGELITPLRYDLYNTACGIAFTEGELELIDGFEERFGPHDELDFDYGIVSYIGLCLRNHLNEPIGTLWIADSKPIPCDGMCLGVLRIFAPTVAAALAVQIEHDRDGDSSVAT